MNKTIIEESVTTMLTPMDNVSITIDEELWSRMSHARMWTMITTDEDTGYTFQNQETFMRAISERLDDKFKKTGQKWGLDELHDECLYQLQHMGVNIIMISLYEL